MSTVYFCWACEAPVELTVYSAEHYESGRTLYFCSPEHLREYEDFLARTG